MAKFKPPPDLAQFLNQLCSQAPERLRELLQWPRSVEEADGLKRRLRGLQLPPHVTAEWKLRHAEDDWRRWREQVEEAFGQSWRDDPDIVRLDQHLIDYLAQLRATLAYLRQQLQPQPQPKPKAKHAGGHPQILTDAEIARLRVAYRAAQVKAKRKQSIVFAELRKLLPKDKRGIKDRTLRRYIS